MPFHLISHLRSLSRVGACAERKERMSAIPLRNHGVDQINLYVVRDLR